MPRACTRRQRRGNPPQPQSHIRSIHLLCSARLFRSIAAMLCLLCLLRRLLLLLPDPAIPERPAQHGAGAGDADDRDGRDALLVDGDEAADEDEHGADVLDDDGGVGDERPELVGLEARVALEVVEEGGFVGVVVGVCGLA